MPNRLTKITTRTGDDGTTGLGDGSRVQKHVLRVEAMGDVDELNSAIGLLLSQALPDDIVKSLRRIQNTLFDLGGELCIPGHKILKISQISELDHLISEINQTLPPLKEFILPGGSPAAAQTHMVRTICRRAERHLVALSQVETLSALCLQYLNRLSDYLFILARSLNRDAGVADVCWTRD